MFPFLELMNLSNLIKIYQYILSDWKISLIHFVLSYIDALFFIYDFITCNLVLPILNFILHIPDKFIEFNEFNKILKLEIFID